MDKYVDMSISQAYMNGRQDFEHYGYDVPCPYEPSTKESTYWHMGFVDASVDHSLYED